MSGKVNGLQTEFVVDTGAEITVVPGNLVYENQLLPESIEIVGATGVPVCTKLADVEFDVMGKNFVKTVAVASAEMFCDKVLYSVPMRKSCAEQLLSVACESELP